MKIVNVNLGPEGNAELDLVNGNIVVTVQENTPGLQGALSITIPPGYFIDSLVTKLGGGPTWVSVGALLKSILAGISGT